jgi:transposase
MKDPAAKTTERKVKTIKRAAMTMMMRMPKMRMRTWMMESTRRSLKHFKRRLLELILEALGEPEAVPELLHSSNSPRRSSQRSE